jgi:dihydropteroate synthase
MHIQGNPQTMQQNPVYENVVLDVFDFLNKKIKSLHEAGINDIIVDPGFGFGKTIAHNFELLNNLEFFQQLSKPLLVGLSRKGTIYKTLGITAEEALNGTTVLNTISLLKGASILRVHDVKEAKQAIQLVQAMTKKREH